MSAETLKILIVDNDAPSAGLLAEALQSTTDLRVKMVHSGTDALAQLGDFQPEIVLLETGLPDVPGIKILEEINTRPELSNTSVILMSEQIDRDLRIIAFSYGAHDFLQKPIEILELLQKIQNLMSIKKAVHKFQDLNQRLQKEKSILVKYFSEDLVARILSEEISPNLGGDLLHATALFFDLRGSTAIAERISPQKFSELLSMLFTDIMDVVYSNQGSVNKLMGDGMLVSFGAPVTTGADALNACRCAMQIRKYFQMFNEIRPSYLTEDLRFGIGIASGKLFAGNIGSSRRMEYTLLGDPVNLAARLESLTKLAGMDILIDGNTRDAVFENAVLARVKFEKVRGKIQTVRIYQLKQLLEGG